MRQRITVVSTATCIMYVTITSYMTVTQFVERLTSNVYLSKAAIIARFARSSKSHDAVEWRKWMINNAQRCASYNHAASGSDQMLEYRRLPEASFRRQSSVCRVYLHRPGTGTGCLYISQQSGPSDASNLRL